MKKILLSVLLFIVYTASFCTNWTITSSGFTFSPATLTITDGDSVHFSLAGIHNAVEVSQATWNANGTMPLPGFSVPFGGGTVLPAQLTVGTHYYVCTAHASMGMKGMIIVQDILGIKENTLKSDFSVYPDPSDGKFQVAIHSSQPAKTYDLEIYDQQGEIVYAKSGIDLQAPDMVDLSGHTAGVYYIRIRIGTEMAERKMLKL